MVTIAPHYLFQKQQLVSPVRKSEEGAAVVGYGGKSVDKDRSNGAGTGNDLQGVGSDSAIL